MAGKHIGDIGTFDNNAVCDSSDTNFFFQLASGSNKYLRSHTSLNENGDLFAHRK